MKFEFRLFDMGLLANDMPGMADMVCMSCLLIGKCLLVPWKDVELRLAAFTSRVRLSQGLLRSMAEGLVELFDDICKIVAATARKFHVRPEQGGALSKMMMQRPSTDLVVVKKLHLLRDELLQHADTGDLTTGAPWEAVLADKMADVQTALDEV